MNPLTEQHNNVLLSIKTLCTHCSLGNDYLDPAYTLAWIYDYYNPTIMINYIYHNPQDIHTHYTPYRLCYTIVSRDYPLLLSLKSGHWQREQIFNICYLTIQGIILHEWQQNGYRDFYNICCENLDCIKLFKKHIDDCLKQRSLQEGMLHKCLEQIRSF